MLASCSRRLAAAMSTAAAAPAPAAAAAAAAAPAAAAAAPAVPAVPAWAVRVPSVAQAVRKGLWVTPSWARYNLESSNSLDIFEARKLPVLSGVADAVKGRKAIIYKAHHSAMTSGKGASQGWRIRFNTVDKWTNPLMGWISSSDTLHPVSLTTRFESPEQAILYCERNGLAYEVNRGATSEDKAGRVDNQYAYVILPQEVTARMKALGPRRARVIFENPDGKAPAFVNYRRTQYGAEPWAPAHYQTAAAWTGPEWPARKEVAPAEGH